MSQSTTSHSSSSNSSQIPDHISPYYLGSADNPSSILVSTVFNGIGFASWKRSMSIALYAKNKFGFVDGTILQPAITSSEYSAWFRVNSMVISWLLNSLHKNIADSVLFLPSAHEIWKELHNRYSQSDGSLIYQIQQQLYSISQGADDFHTYFTKISKIWDELRIVQNLSACTCESATGIRQFLEDQRLIQLLMGLNDSYKVIQGQILMMKPLPTVSTAYSLIFQEERQRDIHVSPKFAHDTMAMQVSNDSFKKNITCSHCKKSGIYEVSVLSAHWFSYHFQIHKIQEGRA